MDDGRIDETGTLMREGGGFLLRADGGRRWRLDLARMPVDHIEKRVRVTGYAIGPDLIDVDAIGAA